MTIEMRRSRFVPLGAIIAVAMAVAGGCAGIGQQPGGAAGVAGAGGGAGTIGTGGTGTAGAGGGAGMAPHADAGAPCADAASCGARCGDGKIDSGLGELCDDGNVRAGDGCTSDCKAIEKDYGCPQPGKACVYLVKCGDGALGGIEQCDPPNAGRGCSADCRIEPGYVCSAPPVPANSSQPASCHKTVCGDGNKEGAEACDDSNVVDGDGCASGCTLEPDCTTGSCVTKCGDGMKLPPEVCDDGNTADGDGCAHDCKMETGFSCNDTTANPPAQLNLVVTYRDFVSFPLGASVRHPDFEIFAGMDVTPNLVRPTLDATGKPVMDGRCAQPGVTAACPYDQQLSGQANFDQWYRDVPAANLPIKSTLLLARQANGAYVYDSAPGGFYPIDTRGFTTVAPTRESTAIADPVVNDGRAHNFGFTTEIRYFFQYRGGESLTFSGDDDVWIFFNRNLALDLGGLHTRTQRTLNVDASATGLGLAVGGLYELVLFHAERHSAGSNFKLTLTGFAPTSSTCRSACGDGVVASTEQCDDGNNTDDDGCSHDCHHEIVVQ
jgi:fibro-slime domain-containing protein